MSGPLDPSLLLFDRRTEPPEEWDICPDCKNEWEPHETWCPTRPSEGYLALQEWRAGPEGTPCPVCEGPKPDCAHWCYEGNAEGEPSYRRTSVDFQEEAPTHAGAITLAHELLARHNRS